MPSPRVRAFIAAMKLRELKEGRDRLIRAYDQIEESAKEAETPADALQVLVKGLEELTIANKRVHPEIKGLELVLRADAKLVQRWIERLRVEIRRGRARADMMPVLGGLYGEWLRPNRKHYQINEKDLNEQRKHWFSESVKTDFVQWIETRVDPVQLNRVRAHVREASAKVLKHQPGPPSPPREILADGAMSEGDGVMSEILPDGTMNPAALEFFSALRIAWETVSSWDWPEEGVTLRPVWTRNRFRLRPAVDFLSAITAEDIGDEMATLLGAVTGRNRLNRWLRLTRLEELSAPDIIIQNERAMLAETFDLFGWLNLSELGDEKSIKRHRLAAHQLSVEGEGYGYSNTDTSKLFSWIATEIDLAQHLGRPIYLLKTDISNFYPSVSHHVVRDLLTWLDVDPKLVALCMRVLSLKLTDGTRTTQGLPLGLSLSRAIGEAIVSIGIGEAKKAGDIQVASLTDDIVIIAHSAQELEQAWANFLEAMQRAGLKVNHEKTSAIAIGGQLTSKLPKGPFRFGLLAHDGQKFYVDKKAVDEFKTITHDCVSGEEAILDQVAAWRNQLNYMLMWLAPTANLGSFYLADVRKAIERVDPRLEQSIRDTISKRYLGGANATLPDVWFHWPLTAGGCGVPWLTAELVPIELAVESHTEVVIPEAAEDWEQSQSWGAWYSARMTCFSPVAPIESATNSAVVQKFLERGKQLGQAGTTLSNYWRYVLQSLGPDVIDAYGTYDFVGTDLVPVELIRQSGGQVPNDVEVAPPDDKPFLGIG